MRDADGTDEPLPSGVIRRPDHELLHVLVARANRSDLMQRLRRLLTRLALA